MIQRFFMRACGIEHDFDKAIKDTMKARKAIVDHLGPWKKNDHGEEGTIVCPCCGADRVFTRAGINGHIWSICPTDGCPDWME